MRAVLAEQWPELQKVFGPEVTKTELISTLTGLLQDQEAEVRAQATLRLPTVGATLESGERRQLVLSILPKIAEVCGDISSHVRIAMSTVIGQLAVMIGKESSIADLIPLLVRLLKDEVWCYSVSLLTVTRARTAILCSVLTVPHTGCRSPRCG